MGSFVKNPYTCTEPKPITTMLKRVSIQNFKSLKDVTVDLQKVNLLIGPNNSGKTNFLKALEFMNSLNEFSNEVNTDYIFKKVRSQTLSIYCVFENDFPFGGDDYLHLQVLSRKKKKYLDIKEYLESREQELLLKRADTESLNISLGDLGINEPNTSGYRTQVNDTKYYFGNAIIYKPDPNKLVRASIVGTGARFVEADASNLIAFFDYIRDDQPEIFARIKSGLKACVPEFSEINFQSVSSDEELIKQFGAGTFKRIGLTNSIQNVKYWADELSEGTLYFLALLCIINQPNPPKLLLLEEPEKGIHPRRIEEVINFILGLADEKDIQVIMTTHSPIVVDMLKDMPESVFIFDKDEEGATYVKNLQTDIIEPETEESVRLGIEPPHYLNGLGQAWKVGFIGGVPK